MLCLCCVSDKGREIKKYLGTLTDSEKSGKL